MQTPSSFSIWFQQIRAPFLILSPVLVLIGAGAARTRGHTSPARTLLLMLGLTLAHIAVNLFNELSDFETKIDEHTTRTPFSGGSGMLQAQHTRPAAVRAAARASMLAAAAVGLYFCLVSGWLILPFMITGAVAIRFYTSHLARAALGELFSGLSLGSLAVLGSCYALSGSVTAADIYISLPPGILTFLLLLLNELPDREADARGGRNHLVITLGPEKSIGLYAAALGAVYLIILSAPFLFELPFTVLIAMATLPLAVSAVRTARAQKDNLPGLIPALGKNVGVVILTDLLLAAGLFI